MEVPSPKFPERSAVPAQHISCLYPDRTATPMPAAPQCRLWQTAFCQLSATTTGEFEERHRWFSC